MLLNYSDGNSTQLAQARFLPLSRSQGQSISLITDLCQLDNPWELQGTTFHRGGPGEVSCHYRTSCLSLVGQKPLWGTQFYACLASRPPHCNTQGAYFCASWNCVTTACWKNNDEYILISLTSNRSCTVENTCNSLNITILQPDSKSWKKGKTWGFRLYVSGLDLGTQFTIQKFEVHSPLQPTGPNKDISLPIMAFPPLPALSNRLLTHDPLKRGPTPHSQIPANSKLPPQVYLPPRLQTLDPLHSSRY